MEERKCFNCLGCNQLEVDSFREVGDCENYVDCRGEYK